MQYIMITIQYLLSCLASRFPLIYIMLSLPFFYFLLKSSWKVENQGLASPPPPAPIKIQSRFNFPPPPHTHCIA